MPRAALIFLAVLAVVAASLWYLQAPPRSPGAYREDAVATAETLASQLATAALWVREQRAGRATSTAAAIAFQEAAADAAAAAGDFASTVPPAGAPDVRAELLALGDAATTRLGDLRIAAEQDDWDEVGRSGGALTALAGRLTRLAEELDGA